MPERGYSKFEPHDQTSERRSWDYGVRPGLLSNTINTLLPSGVWEDTPLLVRAMSVKHPTSD